MEDIRRKLQSLIKSKHKGMPILRQFGDTLHILTVYGTVPNTTATMDHHKHIEYVSSCGVDYAAYKLYQWANPKVKFEHCQKIYDFCFKTSTHKGAYMQADIDAQSFRDDVQNALIRAYVKREVSDPLAHTKVWDGVLEGYSETMTKEMSVLWCLDLVWTTLFNHQPNYRGQSIFWILQGHQGSGKSATCEIWGGKHSCNTMNQWLDLCTRGAESHHRGLGFNHVTVTKNLKALRDALQHRSVLELRECPIIKGDLLDSIKGIMGATNVTLDLKYRSDSMSYRKRAYVVATTNNFVTLEDTENRRFVQLRFKKMSHVDATARCRRMMESLDDAIAITVKYLAANVDKSQDELIPFNNFRDRYKDKLTMPLKSVVSEDVSVAIVKVFNYIQFEEPTATISIETISAIVKDPQLLNKTVKALTDNYGATLSDSVVVIPRPSF